MTPLFLNLVTRWSTWSNSRSGYLYPRGGGGRDPRYQLNRRLRGPHSRSGRSGEGENLLPLPVFAPRHVQPVACRHTDCDIPAPIGLGKNLKRRHLNLNPQISVHTIQQCSEQFKNIIRIESFEVFSTV